MTVAELHLHQRAASESQQHPEKLQVGVKLSALLQHLLLKSSLVSHPHHSPRVQDTVWHSGLFSPADRSQQMILEPTDPGPPVKCFLMQKRCCCCFPSLAMALSIPGGQVHMCWAMAWKLLLAEKPFGGQRSCPAGTPNELCISARNYSSAKGRS